MTVTNVAQLLADRARRRPGLRIGTVDDPMALAALLGRAAGGAEKLNVEVQRPRRAAIVASSSTEFLVAWAACVLAGIPVALVNPTYPAELLTQMLDNLDPNVVFTDLPDRSFAADRKVYALSESRNWPGREVTGALPGFNAAPADLVSFMHTSGTTGVPKFCAQSQEYVLRLGAAVAVALELVDTDRMLAPLPLFHVNPMGYGILGALSAGADALTVASFSARRFWPTVIEHGITALALHAPPVEILKRVTTAADAAGHQVRSMFYADAEFMTRFGIPQAVSGYGSTEAAGVSHLHRWALGQDIPANASRYSGKTRSDIDDRIGESGEIFVRERSANTLFAGYFTDGVLNPARDDDGWFATGDLGRRDVDGGLVFLERAAESIRVKGEFVPIPFVEEKLGTVDELVDLALWKRPGELVDDEVVLFVVADPVPVDSITTAVADLPTFMRPTQVAQVSQIPRDAAAGKVQRRRLHDQEVLSWTALQHISG